MADDTYDYSLFDDAIAANEAAAAEYETPTVAAEFDDIDSMLLENADKWGIDVGSLGSPDLVKQALGWMKSQVTKPDGSVDWSKVLTGAAGAYALFGGGNDVKTSGWSAPPPKMDATRMQVQPSDPNRRPGAGGQRYFTDVQFTPTGDAAALQGARDRATAQIPQLTQAQRPAPAVPAGLPAIRTAWEPPAAKMAAGGQVPNFQGQLQSGGFVVPGDVVRHADPAGGADKERGLAALHQTLGAQAIRGPGDAMSDSIPTTIDGNQPAAVANGEAYVPPQQVARAGGTDRLYQMMDRLRLERTGSRKQINPDNPNELQSAYQQGGGVRRFSTGGVTSGTPAAAPTTPLGQSTTNTLSPYIGEYVTSALSQGAAMANSPYQAYTGPLTAGANATQQQAFAGAQQLTQTGFTPGSFNYPTGQFNAQTSQQYMNPYIKQALDPQLEEMRRQSEISRLNDAGRLTKAGAYGGSRQAIMESEGSRNLLDMQRKALGEGYLTAYDKGREQYNLEQGKSLDANRMGEESRQFSAKYGLDTLDRLTAAGKTQRDIEAEGIAADKAQFEEERAYAYGQPAYQLGLLSGIPIGGSTTTPNTTGLSGIQASLADLGGLYGSLRELLGGAAAPAPAPAPGITG